MRQINEGNDTLGGLKRLCIGASFSPGSSGDIPDGYNNVETFDIKCKNVSSPGFSVNIYDGEFFSFSADSTPIPTSLHSAKEKRDMLGSLVEYPKPLSKLTPSVFQEITIGANSL